MLSKIQFAALLVYSPRGQSDVSTASRKVRDGIKYNRRGFIERAIEHLETGISENKFPGFFGSDVTLVPIPQRAPLKDASSLWPARQICEAIINRGLANNITPCLERILRVSKSAYAAPGERPEPDVHFKSLRVNEIVLPTNKITLVDDFITRGSTILGAASALCQNFPQAEIRAFAVVRTMGLVKEIESIVEPCVGIVWIDGHKIVRET